MDVASNRRSSISFLTQYFLIILLLFGCLLLALNSQFIDTIVKDTSIIEVHLKESLSSFMDRKTGTTRKNQKSIQISDSRSENANEHQHRLSGLNCDKWGGPSHDAAQEMVYWEDIPSDERFASPFHQSNGPTQYLTFEPDGGGWNNIRMAMETLLTTSFAMGRTLVLPPHKRMYLLSKKDKDQRNEFSFEHFFHMERISQEHIGFNIIRMDEFLQLFLDGRFTDTGKALFPPNNRTDWNGANSGDLAVLNDWLRESSQVLQWNPDQCMAAFPRSNSGQDVQELATIHDEIQKEGYPNYEDYTGYPVGVDAKPKDRMKENWAGREGLCLYNTTLQKAPWVHFPVAHSGEYKSRMLVHFYAFLFFADWKTDLWTKRFVRDHVRYIDEIQCAAARVVHAIRQGHNPIFDTLHVRRGDFQYEITRISIDKLYQMLSKQIPENATVYIATDERDKSYFNLLKDHYTILFLDDFAQELGGINTNYYGMIDQLVASRGRIFYGCWFSTFTGYINRLRGYHADDHQTPGYEMGVIPSYYYAVEDRYRHMQKYWPVKRSFYAREFPTSWRLIDTGVVDDKERPTT